MAFSTNLGTIWIKDPDSGNWKAVKKMWVKNSSGWQPVVKAWNKIDGSTWEQIFPTPAGSLTTNVASLTFNVYQNNSSAAQTITITNNGTRNLSITNISVSGSSYYSTTITPNSPTTIAPQQSTTITVTVYGLSIGSDTSGTIVITAATGPLGTSTLTIPVTVNILPQYSAISFASSSLSTSKTVPFSMFNGDSLPSTTVTLYNNGNGKTVNISSVLSSSGVINVSGFSSAISSSNSGYVTLTATSRTPGNYTDTITITSDDTSNPTITINVTLAVAAKLPRITVSPTQLSTAYYDTDTTGPAQTVTITNSGQATLTISSIVSASGGTIAAISGLTSSSIAPSASATFVVTGQQLSASRTDVVTISSNAGTITINVSYTITVKQARIQVYPSTVTPTATQIVTGLSQWTLGLNNIPIAQTMIIKNTSTGPTAKNLSITSISSSQGKCSFRDQNGTALAFPITVTPGLTFSVSVQLGDNYITSGQEQIDTIIINSNTTTPTAGTIEVSVKYTYTPDYPNISVYLNGTNPPALTTINLGTVYIGDTPAAQTVNIKNTELGAASLNVTGISSATGYTATSGISFPVSIAATRTTQFQLTFAGWSSLSERGTPYTDTINIASNDPDNPTYQITVTGLVQPKRPSIKLDKTSYSLVFDVDDPTPPTTEVKLTNNGNKELNITSLSSTNSKFTVSPSSVSSLAVGDFVILTLQAVSQSDVGSYKDSLRIISDASNATGGLLTAPVTVTARQPAETHAFIYDSDSYTFRLPYSVRGLKLLVTGAGGGGGSATESGKGGGGGGGGAGAIFGSVAASLPTYNYVDSAITVIPKNTNITVTIGKGGTALPASGATRGQSANPGEFSRIVIPAPISITVTANGGLGGIGATPTSGGSGGSGGSITVAKPNVGRNGINGGTGQSGTADNSSSVGGDGGSGYSIKFLSGTILHTPSTPEGTPYTFTSSITLTSGLGGNGANSIDRTAPNEFTGINGGNGFVAISWDAYTPTS
jgi:hypothetical protein